MDTLLSLPHLFLGGKKATFAGLILVLQPGLLDLKILGMFFFYHHPRQTLFPGPD
jgi:hypothetical protein